MHNEAARVVRPRAAMTSHCDGGGALQVSDAERTKLLAAHDENMNKLEATQDAEQQKSQDALQVRHRLTTCSLHVHVHMPVMICNNCITTTRVFTMCSLSWRRAATSVVWPRSRSWRRTRCSTMKRHAVERCCRVCSRSPCAKPPPPQQLTALQRQQAQVQEMP